MMFPTNHAADQQLELVVYLIFCAGFVVFVVPVLCVVWALTSGLTERSLSRYPQLVPSSPQNYRLWRRVAAVPMVGPLIYAVVFLQRRQQMGAEKWQAIRARPRQPQGFVPSCPANTPPSLTSQRMPPVGAEDA